MVPTFESPGEFSTLIEKHAKEIDLVVIGGGDGSVRSGIAGLLKTKLPLGVIPLGTANNFARNLGIVGDVEVACDVLVEGEEKIVDVAEVNGFYFLNVAGLGLSTDVNQTVPKEFKRTWGVIAYIVWAFKTWSKSRAHHVWITCDGKKKKVRTHQLTICNGRFFGNGLTIAPEAEITDGKLDLISLESRTLLHGIGHLIKFIFGTTAKRDGFVRLSGEELEIRTSKPKDIDTDGEILTQTPAVFKVHRSALRVIALKIAVPPAEATV